MAQIVCPVVSAEDRARLEAIVADRNRAQKHVARAQIILGSADRGSVAEVGRRAGVGRPAVWRWQRRFAEAGVDGLLRDATRKPGKAPLADTTVRRVVALTCAEPPGDATHWTGRAMAKVPGISLRSVQRIWAAHDLQPHRIRAFKRSNDPDSPPSSTTSSASTSPRPSTPLCSRLTRSRVWMAPGSQEKSGV
jgi:transposase